MENKEVEYLQAEVARLRQKYADDLHVCNQLTLQMQQELHSLRHDYEVLRVQKGGFGFKMLALWGFSGFIAGIIACYLFFRPTNARAEAFAAFQRDHQIHLEYALNHGHFDEAEQRLTQAETFPEYQPAHEAVAAMQQLVKAARKGCGR